MNLNAQRFSIFFICVFLFSISGHSEVKLPKLISDGMVLQRNSDVKIWGWASVNEKITLNFNKSNYETITGECGKWEITLSDFQAGGPYEMTITGSNSITIKDILIGDVWICSGQSNMEISMQRVSPLYPTEIAEANNPNIRYFEVPKKYNFQEPQNDFPYGQWQSVNQETILKFSAVAYFFATELNSEYKIPMGLILTALGGSPAEAWMSEDALIEFPEHFEEAQKFKNGEFIKQIQKQDRERISKWYSELRKKDDGYKEKQNPWYKPDLETDDWLVMDVPGFWAKEKIGKVNGVVWFRKIIDIPQSMASKPAKLNLGRIVDADSVYINGVFVGTTGYQYPPRRYNIPESVLQEGNNIIVVRVISNIGKGGFAPDKPYELICEDKIIDLKGKWLYKLGTKMEPLASQTFIRWKPAGLYNAMLAPLLNINMKGIIWYQGESNAERPIEYRKMFPALINDWREKWDQDDFPFLFVQLPNFMKSNDQPSESNWALCREAQLKALSLPNTGMAVAIDIGEWNDIHPLNKKDVGKRLALAARKVAYGEDIVYSGPTYKSMKNESDKIIISFNNIGSGLTTKDSEKLKYFAIAGQDKKFVWAKAKIEDDKVIVWNDKIKNPFAVRYAWADNPDGANLYNKEGLPASPFRTDQ